MSPVRVLTVDDQAVFLTAARVLIDATPGFVLAGEVTSGLQAIEAAADLHPDLVLLDVRMPQLDGIETARQLTAASGGSVIVLVSGHDVDDVREFTTDCGAADLVQKERLRPGVLRKLWAKHGHRDPDAADP
jgi:two-component system invasion response regulator UvrY